MRCQDSGVSNVCRTLLSVEQDFSLVAVRITNKQYSLYELVQLLPGNTKMSSCTPSDTIQIITYIRRALKLIIEQFYTRWRDVHAPIVAPWAQKYDILSYRQIHTAGIITPLPSFFSAPNSSTKKELSKEPVQFDGTALFEVRSLEEFRRAFDDPYFKEVVEKDKWELIDKEGLGRGIVASYNGKMVSVISAGESLLEGMGSQELRIRRL